MASTGLISKLGLDFNELFIPGNGTQSFDIFDVTGVDVGTRYVKGDSGLYTGFLDKDGKDIGRLLGNNAVTIRRTISSGDIHAQAAHGSAHAAGLKWLEEHPDHDDSAFFDHPATLSTSRGEDGWTDHYTHTSYHCFRLYSAIHDPNLEFTIEFEQWNPENDSDGFRISEIREVGRWQREFVISGGGGDTDKGTCDYKLGIRIPGLLEKVCTGHIYGYWT